MTSAMSGAASPGSAVGQEDFVRAMGHHVASVCVITTQVGGQRFGLTATAVSSVSSTPPRLLVCVNKSGITHEKILEAGCFCVNVLGEDQDHVAKLFAGISGKDIDRFSVATWHQRVTGAPVLAGAAAAFECRIGETSDQSTHTVLFGDVVAVEAATNLDPLLYGLRRFRHLRKTYSRPSSREAEGEDLYLSF